MVPANVIKRAQRGVFAAGYDDWLAREVRCKKVSFVAHLIRAARGLPRSAKHALLLQLRDLRVEIPRRRNRPRVVQRVVRIVQTQKIANVSFHEALPGSVLQTWRECLASLIPRNL